MLYSGGSKAGVIQAYHDIGDGGLIASVAEMQFASRMAITLALSDENLLGQLFAEELGAVVQVLPDDVPAFVDLAKTHGVSEFVSLIGQAKTTPAGGAGLDVLSITTPSQTLSLLVASFKNSGQKLAMPSKVCVIIQSSRSRVCFN